MPCGNKRAHPTKDIDAQHPSDEEDDEPLKPDFLDNEDEETANSNVESGSDRDSPEPPPKAKGKGKKGVQKENRNVNGGGKSQVVQLSWTAPTMMILSLPAKDPLNKMSLLHWKRN